MAEIQNLNNVLQDPDFIKHGKILRENYKSPKTPNFEQIPFSTDSLQIQNDFINNYGDIQMKEFNDTFDKIKNTMYSVSSSEMFERFNQKLNDDRIYNLLCKCFIPYIYQKFSSSSFSRDTPLIKNDLSFLNLSIIGGIISLRNTENNNKKYAQNIFSLNILMTNIERKIIFIYDEMTKLYRKFNVMKLVALGRGIILPNAFEMVLSLPAFDICKSCFYS